MTLADFEGCISVSGMASSYDELSGLEDVRSLFQSLSVQFLELVEC